MRQHVTTLLERLDPNEFEQFLAAPADFVASLPTRVRKTLAASLVEIGDDVGLVVWVAKATALAQQIVGRRADIVHCHGYRAAAIGSPAAWLARRPTIITAHNLFPNDAPSLARATMAVISAAARRIIAVAPAVKESLTAAGVNQAKITVIPNGVEIPQDLSVPSVVPGVEVPPGSKLILCAARLTRVKGVHYMIEAAPRIALSVPSVRVLIAGDGPDREELMRLADLRAPSLVSFLGFREDVPELMKLADVVAIPSLAEGFPITLAEAMAHARPIVASAVGGIADAVKDNETGLLVRPGDPEALAEALVKVLCDSALAARLGANARRFAVAKLSVEAMVRRTGQLYREVRLP